jgi:hypothetical protein
MTEQVEEQEFDNIPPFAEVFLNVMTMMNPLQISQVFHVEVSFSEDE